MSSTNSIKELKENMLDQVESIKEKLTDKEYKYMLDTLMKVRVEEENLYLIRYIISTPTKSRNSEEDSDAIVIISHPYREMVKLTDEELSDFNHFRYTGCISPRFREVCEKRCWNISKELDTEIIITLRDEVEVDVPVKVSITDIQKL